MTRTLAAVLVCLFVTLAAASAPAPAPAPAPQAGPEKWEYCELYHQVRRVARPAGMAGQAAQTIVSVRLVTPDDEMEAAGWNDMATKLKAPAAKMNAPEAVHKLRVFNQLGAEGWEVISHAGRETSLASESWLLKRKVRDK